MKMSLEAFRSGIVGKLIDFGVNQVQAADQENNEAEKKNEWGLLDEASKLKNAAKVDMALAEGSKKLVGMVGGRRGVEKFDSAMEEATGIRI